LPKRTVTRRFPRPSGQHQAVTDNLARLATRSRISASPRLTGSAGTYLTVACLAVARAPLRVSGQGVLEEDQRRCRPVGSPSSAGARLAVGVRAAHTRACLGALLRERRTAPSRTQRVRRASTGHPRSLCPQSPAGHIAVAALGGEDKNVGSRGSFLVCLLLFARRERTTVLRLPGGVTREHHRKPRALRDAPGQCPVSLRNMTSSVGKYELGTVALPPNESARTRRDDACRRPSHTTCQVAVVANPALASLARLATSYHMLIRRARGTTYA
jgi:hypothetical protein